MTLALEVHRSPAKLDSLHSEWDGLLTESRVSNPFLTWEWISTWWRTFSAGSEPWVVSARESEHGKLVGLAPFVIRTTAPSWRPRYRELSFMGSTPVAPDHLDVPVLPGYEEAVASELVELLRSQDRDWDVFRFEGVSGNSLLVTSLLERTRPRWIVASQVSCPFIRLPPTWEEYQSTLGQKLRYNLRSRDRRLRRDASGEVHFHTTSNRADLPGALSKLFALHDRVRQQQGVPSSFTGPGTADFHRRVADLFHRNGWLRLHFLSVDGDPIAAAYCFHYRDVAYFYQTAYDPDWARYGPGAAILAHAIQRSIEDGAREFDFLRGDESYKLQWANQSRDDRKAYVGSSTKGKLLMPAYRRKRRMPQAMQRTMRKGTSRGRHRRA